MDANFLVALVDQNLPTDDRARLDHFISRLEKTRSHVVIPMPALAEFLVGADRAGLEFANKLERKAYVELAPFDRMAAYECAQIDRAAFGGALVARKNNNSKSNGSAKKDGINAAWQKIKIDRQIVAIAKARGVTMLITGDDGVRGNALRVGITAMTIQELELPESARQASLAFEPRIFAYGVSSEFET